MDIPELLIRMAGVHSLGFALFHLAFWKLFDWKRDLARNSAVNRAVMQILNLRLIYVFVGMGAACLLFTDALLDTPLGRALLVFMALFWVGRTIEQGVFLRIHHWGVHTLTALFLLGAALFAVPLLLPA
jgi:hypothetical protein